MALAICIKNNIFTAGCTNHSTEPHGVEIVHKAVHLIVFYAYCQIP